jgi:hypothetical protein
VTTNTLAKQYTWLSADERFSLLLAATARGDEVEANRLAKSGPPATFSVSNAFCRSMAFLIVSALHQMQRLSLAALYFKTSALSDTTTGELSARCRDCARLYAYLVNIHADAWLEFCRVEDLTPMMGTAGYPGEEVIERAAEEARLEAFTEQEAQDYIKRPDSGIDKLKTMTSVADELQETYKTWIEKWD